MLDDRRHALMLEDAESCLRILDGWHAGAAAPSSSGTQLRPRPRRYARVAAVVLRRLNGSRVGTHVPLGLGSSPRHALQQ